MTQVPVSNQEDVWVQVDPDVADWLIREGLRVSLLRTQQVGNPRPKVAIKDIKTGKWKHTNLARLIMNPGKREYVRHLNGDFLDCRRANLGLTPSRDEAGKAHPDHAHPLDPVFVPGEDKEEDYWDRFIFTPENKKQALR